MRKIIRFTSIIFSCIIAGIILLISALSLMLPENYFVNKGDTFNIDSWLVKSTQEVDSTVSNINIDKSNYQNYTVDLKLLGVVPVKKVNVDVVEPIMVVPAGTTFGVKMFTEGVLVIGMDSINTADGQINPAKTAGICTGDIIESINGKTVNTNEEVSDLIRSCQSDPINLTIRRKNMTFDVQMQPVKCIDDNSYKVGLWVRDSSAGIGTMTFYLPENNIFAGLGHGIYDVDTKVILPLMSGEIVGVKVNSIVKGSSGEPGELRGSFNDQCIGNILENQQTGIFGYLNCDMSDENAIPMAMKQDIKEGYAQIICSIDNTPKYYDIEIEKVYMNSSSETKNMIISITDERLLDSTGGIVQGMSGSPIIQNGHLVGAVTHVFVNDPTKGYGIFAENMLKTIQEVSEENQLSKAS